VKKLLIKNAKFVVETFTLAIVKTFTFAMARRLKMSSRYAIDVPNGHDPESNMITYGIYQSKEEAIKYAKHLFGSDDEGRVLIVTEFEEWEDE
tara:strand:- start:151 stop:429 length:279 start_codon:yes stop_codon:yes gene_type:complete